MAAGLARGAEQQGGQFVHPLDGGSAGRRRRGRRCWAQPVIPPQHRPQHPRVDLSAAVLLPLPPLRSVPSGFLFARVLAFPVIASSRSSLFAWRLPSGTIRQAVAARVAGELNRRRRASRLDDDDARARSPRAAGAYHRGPVLRVVSDARRQLRLKFQPIKLEGGRPRRIVTSS